jgi:hypothetical protein
MLRDVVIHILNEQPLLADLLSEPLPSDAALICRNLRTMNGRKPIFVDKGDSTFVLPLASIRFLEIHRDSIDAHQAEEATEAAREMAVAAETEFAGSALARLDWDSGDGDRSSTAPDDVGQIELPSGRTDPDELDDDLLRRIREA